MSACEWNDCEGCEACPDDCRECTGCQRDCECYTHGNEYVPSYDPDAADRCPGPVGDRVCVRAKGHAGVCLGGIYSASDTLALPTDPPS